MACAPDVPLEPECIKIEEPVCQENKTVFQECNRCMCSNGNPACTRMGCTPCDRKWRDGKCQI